MSSYTYSKQVTRQLAAATKTASSALELAGSIAERIERKVMPIADPAEPPVNWEQIQKLFGRLLTASGENLRGSDARLALKGVDGKFARSQRNEAADKLRRELRRARFLLDETLSKEDLRGLFPERRNIGKVDPANLARLGAHIVGVLRGESVRARARLDGGEVLNAEALVQALEAATQNLEATLTELEPKLRLEAHSYDLRRQERAEALRTFRSTRELLRGFYQLAGFDHLADELRDQRRRRKPEPEGEEEATNGGTPPPSPSPAPAAAPAAEVPMS